MKDFLDLLDMMVDDTFDPTNDETKRLVNAIVSTPLSFNLKTDKDKNCVFELGMAGVKKQNVKITKKGRTFTITCVGVENEDKDEVYYKKGLKVPSEKDIISNFTVPEIFDTEKATFDYTDGRLTIVIPLSEEEKAVNIEL